MKGILIEPGRDPEPANLPDTLSAMETRLGGTVEQASPSTALCAASLFAAPSSATAGAAVTSNRCPALCSPRCSTA